MTYRRARPAALGIALLFAFGLPAPSLSQGPGPSGTLAPIQITADGFKPQVLVDQIGTAHVIWTKKRQPDGGADELHYCQIPRGGSSCAREQTFVPPEEPAEFNREYGASRILQTADDEIVLVTHRNPAVVVSDEETHEPDPACYDKHPGDPDACYGSSHNSTWAYISHDGGASFGPAHLLGTGRTTGDPAALIGGREDPRLALISDTETGGTIFQAVSPRGYSRQAANLSDPDPNRAYSGSVAAIGGRAPIAAFADAGGGVFVRVWPGAGAVNEAASWRPAIRIGGDGSSNPRIAGGSRGPFLMYRTDMAGATRYVVQQLDTNGRAKGSPTVVSGEDVGLGDRDFFQDSSGGLHAAWAHVVNGKAMISHRYRPPRRSTFEPAKTLLTAPAGGIDLFDISAAEDGGGFAVWSNSSTDHGVITAVPFGSQAPLLDVRVTGVEVTQAIQAFDLPARNPSQAPAPVAYKGALLGSLGKTVVRVYANSRGALPAGTATPTVRLRMFRDGKEIGTYSSVKHLLPEFSPPSLQASGATTVPRQDRLTVNRAYTFTIPWGWTYGNTTLVAEINPPGLMPSVGECSRCLANNSFTLTGVSYRKTTDVIIHPITLKVNGELPAGFPLMEPIFAKLKATSPLHIEVQPNLALYDASYIENEPDWDRGEKGAEAREIVEDWSEDYTNELSSRYPIGIFPDSSTIGGQTNGGGKLYGDKQPQSVTADSPLLAEVAHEVGHGLGLPHAGQNCPQSGPGQDQEGQFWTPDNRGLLDGIGLDRSEPSPYEIVASGAPGKPAEMFDLMSYCALGEDSLSWTTIHNWNYAVLFRAPPQTSQTSASAAGSPAGRTLRVVGFFNKGSTEVASVGPDVAPATPIETGAPLSLVARDAAGAELARSGVEIERNSDASGFATLTGYVAAPGAASVAFERGGAQIAARTRSAAAPWLKLLSPKAGTKIGTKANTSIRWRVTDSDAGDQLLAAVQYSADGGRDWKTVAFGESRGQVRLPSRFFTASRRARVRVTVNDGFNETAVTSPQLRSLGGPPAVSITSPLRRTSLAAGSVLLLEGSAYDDRVRRLTGRRLQWRVGRRGVGRGEQVTVGGLPAGRHKVTLLARDSRGRRGSRSVTVRIRGVKPLFTLLRGPKRISRQARVVSLRVATTLPATLVVGGKRFSVSPRSRAISVPIRRGRGNLNVRLELRSGGKRTRLRLPIARR